MRIPAPFLGYIPPPLPDVYETFALSQDEQAKVWRDYAYRVQAWALARSQERNFLLGCIAGVLLLQIATMLIGAFHR